MADIETVSVFGLGKVGITLVAALLGAGFRVIGVDVHAGLVEALNEGMYTTEEPGVMPALSSSREMFTATLSAEEAVAKSDISFIIVPTPSNSLGGFSNRFILRALETIGAATAKKASHVVSVVSTVMPGSSQAELIPAFERAAGRRLGERLGYCYNPSFIAQGEVMKGIVTPEYVMIGQSDSNAGDLVELVHARMIRNGAPIIRLTPIETEITKLASNTHETMRVAFANMLLALCNEVQGADVDKITHALGFRLGKRFFKGAVPYGGPCWPRDNQALAVFMDLVGVPSLLPNAIDRANFYHGQYVLRQMLENVPYGGEIALMGLAYKPGTTMIDESFGIQLARWLTAEGRKVAAWDPRGNHEAKSALGDGVRFLDSAEACLACQAAAILLPLAEIDSIDWSAGAETRLIDCWRVLSPTQAAQVGGYVPLGRDRTAEELHKTPIGSPLFGMLVN